MDSRYENQMRQLERELREQNFFSLEVEQTGELKEGMQKVIASAYIRYKMSMRACSWKAHKENARYIQEGLRQGEYECNKRVDRLKKCLSSLVNSNIDFEPIQCMYTVEKNRDQIYSGGVFKAVNSYVYIIESINDEKTKYLYRDQQGIGLKKSDQINHSDIQLAKQAKRDKKQSEECSSFITRYSEHLLKCVIKDLQYYYGYNFKVLKIFQKEIVRNSDFRIPHLWWKAFQERYRQLIEHKRMELDTQKKSKVNVFKYNYFLCPICLQYNCMIHKSCNSNNSYLRNDNWTTLFDKNIPKNDIHEDKIKDFLTLYNGSNYALKFKCKDPENCYRNIINKNKQDLISVQQFSFNNLDKRWIHTLLYFSDCFSFQNPCFLSIILNLISSPKAYKFKCKDINQFIKNKKPQYYSKEKIEKEIKVYMQCRQKEYLKSISSDTKKLFDNDYIQKKYYLVPEIKQDILNQLKDLSEMLKCNYTPCFHKGVCDADSGCYCYRNRDLLEKMQKRIDKLKNIDRKQKKNTKQVLELSFDNNSIFEDKVGKNQIDDEDNDEQDDSDDPLYMQYQEIIGKFLHECERFCGCPNYCRSKNKKLGCSCLNDMTCQSDKSCMCRGKNRECDPEVCRCFCNRNARTIKKFGLNIDYCTNTQALYNCKPRVILGKSLVCEGLGLFAGQDFKKNHYIGCYIGEIINEKQGTERQEIQQPQGISYLFMLNKETDVDSFRYGNKMRYVNHNCGVMANCKVDVIYSRGINIVRFSANQEIAKGQEIYFDYNRNYKIEWMKGFNECYDKFEAEDKKSYISKKITSKYIKA